MIFQVPEEIFISPKNICIDRGVTYYMSLMPGGFKAFSNGYDLTGVWCCVGTGMENHSKHGEAIFFHNKNDVLVNLFIPSQLQWKEKGLLLSFDTKFPQGDEVVLHVGEAQSFAGALMIRHPRWVKKNVSVFINGKRVRAMINKAGYLVLHHPWKKGDVITFRLPQSFRIETAKDDDHLAAIFRGPVLLATPLGAEKMPGSDLVRHAHQVYREWVPPTDDIPVLIANRSNVDAWMKLRNDTGFASITAVLLDGKQTSVTFIPYYKLRHERQNAYFKLFSPAEWEQRKIVISDEINTGDGGDEKRHHVQGMGTDTTRFKDNSNFWENNRIGRGATGGGWFSYKL